MKGKYLLICSEFLPGNQQEQNLEGELGINGERKSSASVWKYIFLLLHGKKCYEEIASGAILSTLR